jgi:hypothetical protein
MVKALLSREASMPSDYYWKEKCITWKNSIVGFAIWFFLITAMFLLDSIAYYTAETNDMVAPPNIYVSYDDALEGED